MSHSCRAIATGNELHLAKTDKLIAATIASVRLKRALRASKAHAFVEELMSSIKPPTVVTRPPKTSVEIEEIALRKRIEIERDAISKGVTKESSFFKADDSILPSEKDPKGVRGYAQRPEKGSVHHERHWLPRDTAWWLFVEIVESRAAYIAREIDSKTRLTVVDGYMSCPPPPSYYGDLKDESANHGEDTGTGPFGYKSGPAKTKGPGFIVYEENPLQYIIPPHIKWDADFATEEVKYSLALRIAHLASKRHGYTLPALLAHNLWDARDLSERTQLFLEREGYLTPIPEKRIISKRAIYAQSMLHVGAGAAAGFAAKFLLGRAMKKIKIVIEHKGEIVEQLAKTVESVRADATKALGTLNGFMKTIAVGLPLVALAFYLTRHPKTALLAAVVVGFLKDRLDVPLWDAIRGYFCKPGSDEPRDPAEVTAQGGEDNTAGEVIATVLTFAACDGKNAFASPQEIHKRMSFKCRAQEGWSSFANSVVKAVEWFINIWRDMFGKERIQLVKTGTYVCDEWDKRVKDFLNPIFQGKREVVPADGNTCADFILQGETLQKAYSTTPPLVRLLERNLNALRKFQGENRGTFSVARGTRAEPICLCLLGEAGVGKSHLMKTIVHSVLAGYLEKSACEKLQWQFDDEVYSHDSGQYWEGYRNQTVLVIDDWLQATMAPGTENNDAMTLIRAVNEWPWPLNMAFGGKGCTFFRSPLVCLTTNARTLKPACAAVGDTDALKRRIHLPFQVVLKPEYANAEGRLDVEKHTAKSEEVGYFYLGAWTLKRHDFDSGKSVEAGRTVESVIAELTTKMKERFGSHRHHSTQTAALAKRIANLGAAKVAAEAEPSEAEKEELEKSLALLALSKRRHELDHARLVQQHRDFVQECARQGLQTGCEVPVQQAAEAAATPQLVFGTEPIVAQSICEITESETRLASPLTVDAWLKSDSLDVDELNAALVKVRCQETLDELKSPQRRGGAVKRVTTALDPRPLAQRALEAFSGFFSEWHWLVKGALIGVFIVALGATLKEVSKQIFGLLHHKEDKHVEPIEDYLSRQAGQVHRLVLMEAVKLAKTVKVEDLDAEGNLPSDVYEKYVARKKASAESNARESKADMRRRLPYNPGQSRSAKAAALHSVGVEQDVPWSSRAPRGPAAHSAVEAQSINETALNIREKARRNAFKVVLSEGERRKTLGTLTLVRGDVAIMPQHFISVIEECVRVGTYTRDSLVELINCERPILSIKSMTVRHFLEADSRVVNDDCILTRFPLTIPSGSDLVKFFMTEHDYANVNHATLLIDPFRIDHTTNVVSDTLHTIRVEAASDIEYSTQDARVVAERTYEYRNSPLANGDCGALVYVADNTGVGHRVLAGFHVAGSSDGLGYALVPTQEAIVRALDSFALPVIAQCTYGMPECTDEVPRQEGLGSIMPIARVVTPINQPGKSRFLRTELHNRWGVCGEIPGMLAPFRTKDSGTIDPMRNALASYAGPIEFIDPKDLKRAAYTAFRAFDKVTTDWTRKVYSFEEAVLGDPYVTNASALTMSTSPGYPWNIEGHTDKNKIFGGGPTPDFTTEYAIKLREQAEEVITRAKRGERCVHIFSDFLKDQLMKIGKVAKGKARLISGAPLLYVIVWRMYFLSFTAAVQSRSITSGIAIGMNPYKDWEAMVRHLHALSPHMVAGDYTAFDGRELQQVHVEICANINRWYSGTAEESLVRRVLYMEVYNSTHITGFGLQRDLLVKWSKSLPSGHPATAVLNSFYNLTILVLMFNVLTQSYGFDFWDVVRPVVYGDDNVVAVSPAVARLFNQDTLALCAPLFGMTYTPEDKESTGVKPVRSIFEVSFLKRRFVKEGAVWLCPLELDSILWVCYWVRDANRSIDITSANFEAMFRELALHDRETWALWVPRILEGVQKYPVALIPQLPVEDCDYYRAVALSRDAAW